MASSQLLVCPQVVLVPQDQPDGCAVAGTGAGVVGAGPAGVARAGIVAVAPPNSAV